MPGARRHHPLSLLQRVALLLLLSLLLLFPRFPTAAATAPAPAPAAYSAPKVPGSRFSRHRPTPEAIDAYLQSIAASNAAFNHERVGETRGWLDDTTRDGQRGWRVVRLSVPLGEGEAAYRKSIEVLRRWRMHEGSGDTGIVRAAGGGAHPPVVTLARAYGGLAWVLNPCRVSYEAFDVNGQGGKERWSAVAYATAGKHLIAGEERMRVVWRRSEGGDTVTFEVLSIARGSGPLGRLVFPFNRGMQSHFFKEQLRCMRRLVAAEAAADKGKGGR